MLWIVLVCLLLGTILWIAFRNSDLVKLGAAMHRQVNRVLDVARDAYETARTPAQRLGRAAREYAEAQREDARLRFPLEDLRRWIDGRVQWSALQSAGIRSLSDLRGVSGSQLQSIRGVGPATVSRVLEAARLAEAQIEERPIRLPGPKLREPEAAPVVAAALDAVVTRGLLRDLPTRLETHHRALAAERRGVSKRITFLGWVLKSGSGEEHSELMRDARAVEYEAREYLDGEDVQAFRTTKSELKRLREDIQDPQVLMSRYAEKNDEVLRVIMGALKDTLVEGPHETGSGPAAAVRPATSGPPRRNIARPPRGARRAQQDIPSMRIEPSAAREDRSPTSAATWVPPGHSVEIAGFKIPGGMLYVGKRLAVPGYGDTPDPALINPRLRIARDAPDWTGELMSYWPSYSEIAPQSRAAYLHWLAEGRQDPDAYIGYVFLFFYGLERRMLRDASRGEVSPEESLAVLGEVERLLSIYGHNGSFRGYAGNFADVVRLTLSSTDSTARPPARDDRSWDLPLGLRMGLGAIVQHGRPIPADWARAWIVQHPNTHLRTPARRCSEEFNRLFDIEYQKRFGQGMELRPPKRKLTATYHPASAAFRGAQPRVTTDVPDVAALRKPIQALRELVDDCTDALDSYSRLLGRNPNAAGDLSAIALLPRPLVLESNDERIDSLSRRLEGALGPSDADSGVVDISTLFGDWPLQGPGAMSKREAVQRIRLLSALGFGIEPDVRFGGPALSGSGRAVVFPLGPDAPEAPSEEYAAGALLLHLAAAVAASDGDVSSEEEEHLEHHLESALSLTATERTRLRAYMRWSLLEPPSLKGLTKGIRALDVDQRTLVGRFLVTVACTDGRVEPDEVKLLAKVYRLLDLDPAQVHREIHQVTTGHRSVALEPITVRTASEREVGYAIPRQPGEDETPDDTAVELDMELVKSRMAETAAVSSLLGSIFAEDEPVLAPPPTVTAEPAGQLDAAHAGLLRALAGERTWSRNAFEDLAARFGLLPEGALDVLNEASLDAVDELVCDGEDPLEIDTTIAEAVLS